MALEIVSDKLPFNQEQIEAVASAYPTLAQPLLQRWVMAQYGAAMLQVQAFEAQLASLVLTVRAKERPPSKNAKRALEKSLRKITHLLEHATATEMRNELEGRVDEAILDEIDFLIPWRNRLAHRYLRQRLTGPGEKTIKATPDMPFELFEISNAFTAAGRRVEQEQRAIMATLASPGEVPPGLVDTITLVISELVVGKPPRFKARGTGGAE
jgi:hypothetical protein